MRKGVSRTASILLALAVLLGTAPLGCDDAYAASFSDIGIRTAQSGVVNGTDLCVNLRELIRAKAGKGYSVVQGGCTDGRYVYYLMVSSANQKGKVLKVKLSNHKVVKRGPVVDICHGNGMTYDSARHRLVVVGREDRRTELCTIDANTLTLNGKYQIDYSETSGMRVSNESGYYGAAAIAYIPGYDCFVALQRKTRSLLMLDANFKVIGMARTAIYTRYSGTYQAIDADEKYVYFLLSADQEDARMQPYNLILAMDWNSENLLPYLNGTDTTPKVWMCGNDGNGIEDAVIRVNTKNEAENLYHVTDEYGREHFYMAEYCPYSKHTYVTKKVRTKVKWKKVKKKGKYVWKYKTKYVKKKVKKKIKKAYRKDNYVYDLGII